MAAYDNKSQAALLATTAIVASGLTYFLTKQERTIGSSSSTSSNNSNESIAMRLARPNIKSLQPYRCARDDYHTGVLLDANEVSI